MEIAGMNENPVIMKSELSRQSLISSCEFERQLRYWCEGAVFLVARDKSTRIFLYKWEKETGHRIDRQPVEADGLYCPDCDMPLDSDCNGNSR